MTVVGREVRLRGDVRANYDSDNHRTSDGEMELTR